MLHVNRRLNSNTAHNTKTSFNNWFKFIIQKIVVVLCRLWVTQRVIHSMHNFVFFSHNHLNNRPRLGREDYHEYLFV